MTAARSGLLLGEPVAPITPGGATGIPQELAGELAAVVAVIAGLADGNCVSGSEVGLVGGDAHTRDVDLTMTVALGWGSDGSTLAGRPSVAGSRDCTNADVQDYLEHLCGDACRALGNARMVADGLAREPFQAFEGLEDGYRIAPLPHAAHRVEACGACAGHGVVHCTNIRCNHGKVPCPTCGSSGRARCRHCTGSGHVTVGGNVQSCSECGGSGYSGNCHMCLGSGHVACDFCRGTGMVGCGPCRETGCITRAYTTYLIGRVTRSMNFAPGAPDGFRLSCEALASPSLLASSAGSLVAAEVDSSEGQARVTLHCRTRHLHAVVACGAQRFDVDALGLGLAVPSMPTFLDDLTAGLVEQLRAAVRTDPARAMELATGARLTREVLADIVRGSRPDLAAVARRWCGAVSEAHVELVDASLSEAYARVVRRPVRRTWLAMAPVIAVGSALSNIYQVPLWLLHRIVGTGAGLSAAAALPAILLSETASVLPFVLGSWFLAARAGRRRLRAGIGDIVGRGPRQGVWPALGLLLALCVGFATAALRLDAAAIGLPGAPPALAGGRSLSGAVGGERPKTTAATTTLPRKRSVP